MPYYNRYARTNRTSFAAPTAAWRNRPATEAQVNFTLRLQNEHECTPFSAQALGQMTGGVISELIEQLKQAPRRTVAPAASAPVLAFAPMIALFRQANEHLRFPKVRLQTAAGLPVILSLAGPNSRNAGCIYLKGEGGYGEAPYYGKVNTDGTCSLRNAPAGLESLLQAFSADPAGVAAAYGRLTGNCCFCNRELTDERSTSVGYGPVCANHYHLPWGTSEVVPAQTDIDCGPVSYGEQLGMDVAS